MGTDIQVVKSDGLQFSVTLTGDDGSSTSHEVMLDAEYWEKFSGMYDDPSLFVQACFKFLLEREPKESILSSFNIQIISTYFPEFEDVMLS